MSDPEEVGLSVLNKNNGGEQQVDNNGLITELPVALPETIWVNIFVLSWLWIASLTPVELSSRFYSKYVLSIVNPYAKIVLWRYCLPDLLSSNVEWI
jgi:hypothetical protein